MFRQSMRAVLVAVLACGGLVAAGVVPAAAARAAAPARHGDHAVAEGRPADQHGDGGRDRVGEAVDVYFDITDETLAIAGADGSFSGIDVTVPASALPGRHYISAVSRATGQGAQDIFTVRTSWAQYRYSGKHTGANPYENVLSRATVAGIDLDWAFNTGAITLSSSPAVGPGGRVFVGSENQNVYALDAATGAKLWSFATQGPSSPHHGGRRGRVHRVRRRQRVRAGCSDGG